MNHLGNQHELRIRVFSSALIASVLVLSFVAVVTQLASSNSSNVAYAQTVSRVNGAGDSNTLTCPNGRVLDTGGTSGIIFLNFLLSFSASGTSGSMTGSWTISGFRAIFPDPGGMDPPTLTKTGTITGGKVSGNHFVLTGVENADALCGGPVPSNIQISGVCQPDQRTITRIQFQAQNGETGTFRGKVTCTRS